LKNSQITPTKPSIHAKKKIVIRIKGKKHHVWEKEEVIPTIPLTAETKTFSPAPKLNPNDEGINNKTKKSIPEMGEDE
jgi:hypothetical protein